jgi:signal transduction histidine kinase
MQPTPIPIGSAPKGSRRELLLHGADHADVKALERVIAVARVFVSLAIVEAALARTDPSVHDLAIAAFLSYGGTSLLVLVALSGHHPVSPRLPILMQWVDIGAAASVPWWYGLSGSLTLLLLFPLLAAGYRQGRRQVLTTAAVIDILIAAQWAIAHATTDLWHEAARDAFDVNVFIASTTLVAIAGLVVGYLAEQEYQRRSQAAAISHVVAQARPGTEFNGMLNAVLASIREVFDAQATVLVLQDTKAARLFRWDVAASSTHEPVPSEEIPAADRDDYLFAVPGDAWHAVARKLWRRGVFDVVAVDAQGVRLPPAELIPPPGFLAMHPSSHVLGVSPILGEEWTGRLFIIEPALRAPRESLVRFAQRLASHAGRVLYGYYLVHKVRTRAQSTERSRIARELHDGITQTLLGLEMEIVALRRRAIAEAPPIDAGLARIQNLLRSEVVGMREAMEGIRAGNNASDDIVEELAEMVERFRRYTGVTTSFASTQPSITMSAHMRRQIALILHEALVNLRKHSRASRVNVRVETMNGRFRLSIEDDGGGFPFAGRRTQSELDALRQGPRMIGERVRMIGGEMIVESKPGLGSSIEISFPSSPNHE